jgi:hypothetical protein
MKNQSLSILAIILISSSLLLTTASAQTVIPGVSNGEIFTYNYNIIWASTDPSAIPPTDLVDYNNTKEIQFKITSVSGSQIGVDFIRIFMNGTKIIQSGLINVDSGIVTVPFGFLIIGANLNKDQRVYPSGGYQTITDTVMRSYASGQRETNVLGSGDSSGGTTIYFDKIRGIAVEYSYEIRSTLGVYTVSSTERMVNTNAEVWSVIPEFPSTAFLMLLLIAIPIVLVAYKKKGLSNSKFTITLR